MLRKVKKHKNAGYCPQHVHANEKSINTVYNTCKFTDKLKRQYYVILEAGFELRLPAICNGAPDFVYSVRPYD